MKIELARKACNDPSGQEIFQFKKENFAYPPCSTKTVRKTGVGSAEKVMSSRIIRCFRALPTCCAHSDVAHFTTHGSNLSCKKSGCCKKAKLLQKVENSSICFCNKICTCCTSNWLLSNLFCSKWRKSRVWRDFRVIVSNQKSVFTQLLTLTRFVVRQVWTWVVKCPTYEANQAARFFIVRYLP